MSSFHYYDLLKVFFEGLLASHFDSKYTLSTQETESYGNYYFFNGYTGTKIFRDPDIAKWKMVGLVNRSQFAICDTKDYPFGTHTWKLKEDDSNMTLNLNGCYDEWQFNCHDGSCIDITARWVQNECIHTSS